MQTAHTLYNSAVKKKFPLTNAAVFGLLWLLVFVLYYPAAKAGFVADFTGWLEQEKYHGFWDNINRTGYKVHSLYQLTQLVTLVFYKLFGINEWLWHLLFITIHTINAWLAYRLAGTLLYDAGANNAKPVALAGAILFCVSPYVSEAIVWEPSFHFLQGLLLALLILLWVQRYVHTGHKKYALWVCIIYFLSTFSLELFYLTPWLVLTLGIFYGYNALDGRRVLNRVTLYFFVPMLLLFLARLVIFRLLYDDWVSRIGSGAVTTVQLDSFAKPAKYIFNLLFLGRFMEGTKQAVYGFLDKGVSIAVFYLVIIGIGVYIIARFKAMTGRARVASLFYVWTIAALLLLIPLWFQAGQLALNDRYTYFTDAFFYMLVSVLLSFITLRYAWVAMISLFALVNLRFAIKVNRYWGKSQKVIYGLLHTIPDERTRTVLLLNLPQNMHGIAMIGAEHNSEFKLMHDLLLPDKSLHTTVYDVMAYNMETPEDGAHVSAVNDSTIRVTLNQWGTWWWFATMGGSSYENMDYKLNLIDPGHFYELTLKRPAQQYLLLYAVGGSWKTVDMSIRNAEQH